MRSEKRKFLIVSALVLFVAASSLGCPDDNDEDPPDRDVGVDEDVIDDDVTHDVDEDVDEDTDPPLSVPEGEFRFNYNNAIEGSFDVTGAVEFEQGLQPRFGSFTYALYDDETLVILAFDGQDDPVGEFFAIVLPDFDGQADSWDFESDCLEQDEPDCAYAAFLRDFSVDAIGTIDDFLDFDSLIDEAGEAYVYRNGNFTISFFPVEPAPDASLYTYGYFHGTAPLQEDGEDSSTVLNTASGYFDSPIIAE